MEQESHNRGAEDSSHRSPAAPILCANNCGFFASESTNNLCSKCYRDFVSKKRQSLTATADDNPKNNSAPSPLPAAAESSEPPTNRCNLCCKRVGLTGFLCRCGHTFCSSHRYSDQHNCTFNYKKTGQDDITRANPVVKADKIERI